MIRFFHVTLLLAAASLCAPLNAAIVRYDVTLDGNLQQFPVNGSAGTGLAHLTLDTVASTLLVDLSYSGLGSNATNAHVHCCAAPGANGPVIVPFIPAGFVLGATSGTFLASFTLTATNLANIQSGLSYINVHTTGFPGGEIRGNITSATIVPEPATVGLMGAALGGLALLRRKRKA